MSNNYDGQNGTRRIGGPRNYQVTLVRFGSHAPGDYKPMRLTAHFSATSSMEARMNAEASYAGYSVTNVQEG